MSSNMIDIANLALEQSPASTRFVTNKMCPYAQKVWIALEVINAPYEMQEVSLYGPNGKPDWFWDLNPDGTVPVLVCNGGGTIIPDSDLALDCIQEGMVLESASKSKSSWMYLPKEDGKNSDLRELVKSWRTAFKSMQPIGKAAVQGRKQQQKTKLLECLQELEDKLEAQTHEGPYLCGSKVTIADCAAFPFLWRINDEFGLEGYDKLSTWLETCSNNKAFSKTVQSAWWWWW